MWTSAGNQENRTGVDKYGNSVDASAINRKGDHHQEKISTKKLKTIFDLCWEKSTQYGIDEVILELSRLDWYPTSKYLSYVNHPVVAAVYARLTGLIDKAIGTGRVLPNHELDLLNQSLDFMQRVLESVNNAFETIEDDDECIIDYSDDDNDDNNDGGDKDVDNNSGTDDDDDSDNDDNGRNNTEGDRPVHESNAPENLDSEGIEFCLKTAPLNEPLLYIIQPGGWNIMKNCLEIMGKVVRLLIERWDIYNTLSDCSTNDESALKKLAKENKKWFNALVESINAPEHVRIIMQTLHQFDIKSLNERTSFLLFGGFNSILRNERYNETFRKNFCRDFWLPKYKEILQHMLAITGEVHRNDPKLITVKYLVTNLIQMQRTTEGEDQFANGQIENFELKAEYLPIINILLSWFSDSYILRKLIKQEKQSDKDNFIFGPNILSNTTHGITIPSVTLTILKLILMFINANGDCLSYVKFDKEFKNIFLKLMEQIKYGSPVKTYIYNILGFALNEKDIQHSIGISKEIIVALVMNIRKVLEESNQSRNQDESQRALSDLLVLLKTLKAYLQHDELKTEFLQLNGLELLLEIAMKTSKLEQHIEQLKSEGCMSVTVESFLHDDNILKSVRKRYIIDRKATEEGQQLALECCFIISYNATAADVLKRNRRFMDHITNLAKNSNTTTKSRLKEAADSILWKLKLEEEFKKEQEKQHKKTSSKSKQFDLMLSYSWGDKPLVRKIFHALTEKYKYQVWLDENEMSGNTRQAMAEAVENSKIIILCLSETYKTSANCNSEADYTSAQGKPFIPLKMAKVELKGQLGFMVGTRLYIDFGKSTFEDNMEKLKSEIDKTLAKCSSK